MQPQAPAYDPSGQQPRPYVRFEVRAVENRARSLEKGDTVWEDTVWVILMAPGSKDTAEYLADEWIEKLRKQAKAGRVPQSWPGEYGRALEEFKKENIQPEFGTALRNWPAISPAQLKNCQAVGVMSVEALAEANDTTLAKLGMGGMALRDMARSWIKERESGGTMLKQLEDLTVRVGDLTTRLDEALAENRRLAALLPQPNSQGPAKPLASAKV